MRPSFVVGFVAVICGCSSPAPTEPQALQAYPAPLYLQTSGDARPVTTVCLSDNLALPPELATTVASWVEAMGVTLNGASCDWTFTTSTALPPLDDPGVAAWSSLASPAPITSASPSPFPFESDDSTTDERSVVVTTDQGNTLTSTVFAASPRALFHALHSALALASPSTAPGVVIVMPFTMIDQPSFPVRGVVEGFYGTPYSNNERLSTIRCMGALRQNRYVYGPKGDSYVHNLWADPYPSSQAGDIQGAAKMAAAWSIDFVWGIAPGSLNAKSNSTSIQFSSDEDFARLVAKIESVRVLGVSRFALLLDDVIPNLIWPQDLAMFSSPAAAHVYLANRLQQYLVTKDPSTRLLFVGTWYAGTDFIPAVNGDLGAAEAKAYNITLGAGLLPTIDVMWTGPNVFSTKLDAANMTAINETLNRQVIIWDNYPPAPPTPVPNPVIPPTGRSVDLSRGVGGLLSNPVLNENDQYPIADFWQELGPLADYEWDSARYDAKDSFAAFNATTACSGL